MINNRPQGGRRRGRGGQRQNGGGNRNQDNGNRIDNRSRGNAAQLLEKYKALARDAQQAGDRVLTEYYLQFADHYFRVLADSRSRFEDNQPRREQRPESDEQGFEGEEGYEGEDIDEFDSRPQARPPAQPRYERERQEPRSRDDDERGPRRDNGAGGYGRSNGEEVATRDPQSQPMREERPRRERQPRMDRADPGERATLSLDILPPAIGASPAESVAEPDTGVAAPKRRGRPKKVMPEATVEG